MEYCKVKGSAANDPYVPLILTNTSKFHNTSKLYLINGRPYSFIGAFTSWRDIKFIYLHWRRGGKEWKFLWYGRQQFHANKKTRKTKRKEDCNVCKSPRSLVSASIILERNRSCFHRVQLQDTLKSGDNLTKTLFFCKSSWMQTAQHHTSRTWRQTKEYRTKHFKKLNVVSNARTISSVLFPKHAGWTHCTKVFTQNGLTFLYIFNTFRFIPVSENKFHFSMLSRPFLGPTQPPIQWAPGFLPLN
jgi:hypothetical protein